MSIFKIEQHQVHIESNSVHQSTIGTKHSTQSVKYEYKDLPYTDQYNLISENYEDPTKTSHNAVPQVQVFEEDEDEESFDQNKDISEKDPVEENKQSEIKEIEQNGDYVKFFNKVKCNFVNHNKTTHLIKAAINSDSSEVFFMYSMTDNKGTNHLKLMQHSCEREEINIEDSNQIGIEKKIQKKERNEDETNNDNNNEDLLYDHVELLYIKLNQQEQLILYSYKENEAKQWIWKQDNQNPLKLLKSELQLKKVQQGVLMYVPESKESNSTNNMYNLHKTIPFNQIMRINFEEQDSYANIQINGGQQMKINLLQEDSVEVCYIQNLYFSQK